MGSGNILPIRESHSWNFLEMRIEASFQSSILEPCQSTKSSFIHPPMNCYSRTLVREEKSVGPSVGVLDPFFRGRFPPPTHLLVDPFAPSGQILEA